VTAIETASVRLTQRHYDTTLRAGPPAGTDRRLRQVTVPNTGPRERYERARVRVGDLYSQPVSRLGLLAFVCLAVAAPSADAALAARHVARQSNVTVTVGPMRLVSPGFGYVVAQRTSQSGGTYKTTIRLLVFDGGHWRDATPPALRPPAFPRDLIDGVDDVAFVDRRHGWLAAFNCSMAAVQLYRTSDGGRSWHSLGRPGGHSCSAPATTFLSFINGRHGWMEPVSPTGPVGALLETSDGGRSWKHVATGPAIGPQRRLPCLAPIRFVALSTGWLGRCDEFRGGAFSTRDGGRHWKRAAIAISDARFDLPWFHGRNGVEAATVGTRPVAEKGHSRAVVFSITRDGGRVWTARSTRRIGSCPLTAYTSVWPTSVVNRRVWWIVSGCPWP
jgi:hypothetical protein